MMRPFLLGAALDRVDVTADLGDHVLQQVEAAVVVDRLPLRHRRHRHVGVLLEVVGCVRKFINHK